MAITQYYNQVVVQQRREEQEATTPTTTDIDMNTYSYSTPSPSQYPSYQDPLAAFSSPNPYAQQETSMSFASPPAFRKQAAGSSYDGRPPALQACSSESSSTEDDYSNDMLIPYYTPSERPVRQEDALVPYVPPRTITADQYSPQSTLSVTSFSSGSSSTMATYAYDYDQSMDFEEKSMTVYSNTPKEKLPVVPYANNSIGSDSIHPEKFKMKKRRQRRTVGGAVGGAIVGGLTLGPAGAVVGAPIGAYATNKIHKARERKSQRKHEKIKFQEAASRSQIHGATFA